jgi:aminoglycoside phosphotransferase (APT) family kinase protein
MGIWSDESERARLLDALLAAWPGGSTPGLRWLSEGFGSAAFESDDGLVALVAKNAIGAHSRHVTCALTPSLAPNVPVAIPQPAWSIDEASGLPFGAYAYPKLLGRPWTRKEAATAPESLAKELAAFILAMNGFSTEGPPEGVTTFQGFWADTLSLREQTDEALRGTLTGDEYTAVQAWWDDFINDDGLQQGPRCVVHGDLWWDNLLVNPGGETLLGVIDFGDAATIDPSYDFVPLLESGPHLLDACMTAYETQGGAIDQGFKHRLQRWWELRSGSFFSLRASVHERDEEEMKDSVAKLRRSPILRATRLEKW